jgi:phage-related protein
MNDVSWHVEIPNETVAREIESLPKDMQAKFLRIARLIEDFGLPGLREPYVRHVQDKLWEMRMKGSDGIARALYIAAAGNRVVVLRAFIKKTPKTPRREIDLALERAKEFL